MPFHKLVSHFLLLAFFNFAATEAADGPLYIDHNCTISKNFTSNSPYQSNLYTLLSDLSSDTAGSAEFYDTTAGNTMTNDAVYGQFMCRGDVPLQLCQDCVTDTTNQIVSECPHNKDAIIWCEECLVRYSDRSFFSTLNEPPTTPRQPAVVNCPSMGGYRSCLPSRSISGNYSSVLQTTLNDAVVVAAESGPAGTKKFATKEENYYHSSSLFSSLCFQVVQIKWFQCLGGRK